MKISDFYIKKIQEYPTLYKDVDFEKSILKMLNQIFFTIGNGLELAETENLADGGYVVESKYKKDKKTDEWVRVYDKPYGKEKFKKIPNGYFDSVVLYVSSCNQPLEIIKRKDGGRIYFRYCKEANNPFNTPKLCRAESFEAFSPYPICKTSSLACDILYNDLFLQDDWLKELVVLCKRTLEYYTDINQYKTHTFYPTETKINKKVREFEKLLIDAGLDNLNSMQLKLGYVVKNTPPRLC